MAYLYRKQRTRLEAGTGRRVGVTDGAGRPVYLPHWRIEYRDWQGNRVDVPGVQTRAGTARLSARLEAEAEARRLGRPDPSGAGEGVTLEAAIRGYLAWGRSAGGRGNRPWDREHAKKREARLAWWADALGDRSLASLAAPNVLELVRARLAALEASGRAGKTVAHYREALVSFAGWAKERGHLAANPFASLPIPDTRPARVRRAPAIGEIHALLAAAPIHRRLLYELAFASGFRAGELRALDLDHLAVDHCRLPAWADKGRREREQPLWPDLAARLRAYAESGDPRRRYEAAYARRGRPVPEGIPARPLVYVPAHPARALAADAAAAGVPLVTAEGVIDFHAARVAYINLVMDAGADLRDAQEMARHATSAMTLGVYGRSKRRKIDVLAEAVGRLVAGDGVACESVSCDKSGQKWTDRDKTRHEPAGTAPELCASSGSDASPKSPHPLSSGGVAGMVVNATVSMVGGYSLRPVEAPGRGPDSGEEEKKTEFFPTPLTAPRRTPPTP